MAGGYGKRKLNFTSGSAGVRMKLDGPWMAINSMMSNLQPDIVAAYLIAQRKIAKKLQAIVKGHIYNQDLGWAALSGSTQSRKGHGKAYYDTGTYLQNIKIITRGTRIYVGIPKNLADARGVYYADIASMMEYGTKNMPARPLWEPSRKEIDRKFVKRVFATSLGKIMLTRHGVTPKFRV